MDEHRATTGTIPPSYTQALWRAQITSQFDTKAAEVHVMHWHTQKHTHHTNHTHFSLEQTNSIRLALPKWVYLNSASLLHGAPKPCVWMCVYVRVCVWERERFKAELAWAHVVCQICNANRNPWIENDSVHFHIPAHWLISSKILKGRQWGCCRANTTDLVHQAALKN